MPVVKLPDGEVFRFAEDDIYIIEMMNKYDNSNNGKIDSALPSVFKIWWMSFYGSGRGRVGSIKRKELVTIWWDRNNDRYYYDEDLKDEILDSSNYYVSLIRKRACSEGIVIGKKKKVRNIQNSVRYRHFRHMAQIVDPGTSQNTWNNGLYIQYYIYSRYYKENFSTGKYQIDCKYSKAEKKRILADLFELGATYEACKLMFPKLSKRKFDVYMIDVSFGLTKKQRRYLINQGIIEPHTNETNADVRNSLGEKY